jgi:hypothetical protein
MPSRKFSKKLCKKWAKKKSVNPASGRKIRSGKRVYKHIKKMCSSFRISKKSCFPPNVWIKGSKNVKGKCNVYVPVKRPSMSVSKYLKAHPRTLGRIVGDILRKDLQTAKMEVKEATQKIMECASGEKFDAISGRCIGTVSPAEVLETAANKLQRLAAECRSKGMKYNKDLDKCVEIGVMTEQQAENLSNIFGSGIEEMETKAEKLKRLAAQCRAKGMKYDSRSDSCVALKQAAQEVVGAAEIFAEQAEQPLKITTGKAPEAVQGIARVADALRQEIVQHGGEKLSIGEAITIVQQHPEIAKSGTVEAADAIREQITVHGGEQISRGEAVQIAKEIAEVAAVDRPKNIELLMEDDCEDYEYPSEDFRSCLKFKDVASTECPPEQIFHYRQMKCMPKSQPWARGEYDIQLKYDNWALSQQRFGGPSKPAPSQKSVYEVLQNREKAFTETKIDKLKRLAAECRAKGMKYSAALDKCVEKIQGAKPEDIIADIRSRGVSQGGERL